MTVTRRIEKYGKIDFPTTELDFMGTKVGDYVDIDRGTAGMLSVKKHVVIPPPPTVLFSDTFPTDYEISGSGVNTPDSKWLVNSAGGGGSIGAYMSDRRCAFQKPKVSTAIDGKETHACEVATLKDFTNFEASFQSRTVQQLRQNFAPKNWEVFWLLWSLTKRSDLNNRSVNHYYFTKKMRGWELGKKDNAETDNNLEEQIYVRTDSAGTLMLGQWYNWVIKFKDFHITVTIDGTMVVDVTDVPINPARMKHGNICMYCEDAFTEVANFVVKPV